LVIDVQLRTVVQILSLTRRLLVIYQFHVVAQWLRSWTWSADVLLIQYSHHLHWSLVSSQQSHLTTEHIKALKQGLHNIKRHFMLPVKWY